MGKPVCNTSPARLLLCQVLKWNNAAWDRELFRNSCANILEELLQEWEQKAHIGSLNQEEYIFILYGTVQKQPESTKMWEILRKFFSAAGQFFSCDMALYVGNMVMFEDMPCELAVIRQLKEDNVARRSGVYRAENGEDRVEPQIRQPDFRTWEKLLLQGMGKQVYEDAMRYLQELSDADCLNAGNLQKFYSDFYRVICLAEERTDTAWEDIFTEEEQRQTALHAYETLQDMQLFFENGNILFFRRRGGCGKGRRSGRRY